MTAVRTRRGTALTALIALCMGLADVPAHADAADGARIASANACMGCHAVDRKLVGPSFREIAARYGHDPQALQKLSAKVRNGGSGTWGVIPMPSHPGMSDADIRTVVNWVLSAK
jgi:cytochrome c